MMGLYHLSHLERARMSVRGRRLGCNHLLVEVVILTVVLFSDTPSLLGCLHLALSFASLLVSYLINGVGIPTGNMTLLRNGEFLASHEFMPLFKDRATSLLAHVPGCNRWRAIHLHVQDFTD